MSLSRNRHFFKFQDDTNLKYFSLSLSNHTPSLSRTYLLPPLQCDQVWQNSATLATVFKSWHIFDDLFLNWQNAELSLANLWHIWDNFLCCKWPYIEKQSNHLVTLTLCLSCTTYFCFTRFSQSNIYTSITRNSEIQKYSLSLSWSSFCKQFLFILRATKILFKIVHTFNKCRIIKRCVFSITPASSRWGRRFEAVHYA